jgi:predicted flap endonuclease-1-like 5' DNA nuclease
MRLDYTLYILASLLLIITVIPFVVTIEGVESDTKTLWVITTVALGLLSIGLGYSQKPKTEAQSCQPEVAEPQEEIQIQLVATAEAPKEEKNVAYMKAVEVNKEIINSDPSISTMKLTQVKGIGEKRASQLKALGINSVDDLFKASEETVAKKLKISPRIVEKWIENAKELCD